MIRARRKPETAEQTSERLEAEEKFKKEEALKNMKTSLQRLEELVADVKNGTLDRNRKFGTIKYWFNEAIMHDKGYPTDRGWFIFLSEEDRKEYVEKTIEIARSIGFNLLDYYTQNEGACESVIKDMILNSLKWQRI